MIILYNYFFLEDVMKLCLKGYVFILFFYDLGYLFLVWLCRIGFVVSRGGKLNGFIRGLSL